MEAILLKIASYILGITTIVLLLILFWALDTGAYKNKYDDLGNLKQRNSWKSLFVNTFISLKRPKDETGKLLLSDFKKYFTPCFPKNTREDTVNIYYQIINEIVSTRYAPMDAKQRYLYLVDLTIEKLKFATLQDLAERKQEYRAFLSARIRLIENIVNYEIKQQNVRVKKYLITIKNLKNEYSKIYD